MEDNKFYTDDKNGIQSIITNQATQVTQVNEEEKSSSIIDIQKKPQSVQNNLNNEKLQERDIKSVNNQHDPKQLQPIIQINLPKVDEIISDLEKNMIKKLCVRSLKSYRKELIKISTKT